MRRGLLALIGLVALGACEPMPPAQPSRPVSGLPDPAVATCMSAVARRTGNGIVEALSLVPSPAGTTVVIGVGDARTPWDCVVGPDGVVASVTRAAEAPGLTGADGPPTDQLAAPAARL